MFGWLTGKNRRPAEQARVEPSISASTTFLSSNAQAWDSIIPGGLGSRKVSAETAMRHAAVFRCVSIVAGAFGMLPIHTFRRQEDGDRERNDTHPAASLLLTRPNPRMTPTTFWRQIGAQMLLQGNGIAWIERKGSGAPIALWPIPMSRVGIDLFRNRLRYHLTLDDGTQIIVDQDDVLHFPGSPEWDGVRAKTPIQAMGSAVGIGLEADRFAQLYFENDAKPSGYLAYPTGFNQSPAQAEELRSFWQRTFGGDKRHSGPAVLTNGGKYETIPITAEDAQLLDTRRFQIEDIGRIFGVPRPLLSLDSTSWGTGIEQLGIFFVTYGLMPHLKSIQDECDWKLFGTSAHFCEFEVKALMQGDMKSQFEAFRVALGGSSGPGFMTQNEIRRRMNLDGLTGGDKLTQWSAKEQKEPNSAQSDPAPGSE